MNTPSSTFRFNGSVTAVAGPGRAGVTLLGSMVQPDGSVTAAELSLSEPAALDLPQDLRDLTVEALAAQEILLRSGAREWRIHCKTWQLHRDVGAVFYAAVPPRRMPWSRRVAWRLMLGLAATGPGRWLLRRRGRAR